MPARGIGLRGPEAANPRSPTPRESGADGGNRARSSAAGVTSPAGPGTRLGPGVLAPARTPPHPKHRRPCGESGADGGRRAGCGARGRAGTRSVRAAGVGRTHEISCGIVCTRRHRQSVGHRGCGDALGGDGSGPIPRSVGSSQPVRHLRPGANFGHAGCGMGVPSRPSRGCRQITEHAVSPERG